MEAIITLKDVEDTLCIAIKKAIAENKEGNNISSAIENNFYDIDPSGDRFILNDFIHGCLKKSGKIIYTDLEKGYHSIQGEVKVGETTDGKEVYLEYQFSDSAYNDGIWSEYWEGDEDYLSYAVREPKKEVTANKVSENVVIPPAHTGKDFKRLQEHTFKYPESKTGEIKDRDLFVLDILDDDSVVGISLHDCADREAILSKAAELNDLISKNMKNFRRFKLDKIVE